MTLGILIVDIFHEHTGVLDLICGITTRLDFMLQVRWYPAI